MTSINTKEILAEEVDKNLKIYCYGNSEDEDESI